jgi:hypothetical protein
MTEDEVQEYAARKIEAYKEELAKEPGGLATFHAARLLSAMRHFQAEGIAGQVVMGELNREVIMLYVISTQHTLLDEAQRAEKLSKALHWMREYQQEVTLLLTENPETH